MVNHCRASNQVEVFRQGDSLLLYLFVMCMEKLYQTIEEAIIGNKWKLIKVSRNGPLLSNLFFTDDIIMFAEATVKQVMVVNNCLQRFRKTSEQKVSLLKSLVNFSKNVEISMQSEICEVLGMEATKIWEFILVFPL